MSNTIKKLIVGLLAIAIVFSLTACSGGEAQNPADNAINNDEQIGNTENGEGGTEPEDSGALYNRVLAALGNPTVSNHIGTQAESNAHQFVLEDGVRVRYIGINALKSGEEVNIMQATDFHFNKMNDRDNAEQNPSVMDTRKYRKGFRDESTVPNVKRVLEYGKKFDAVAITGDIIDYLTWGSLDLVKEHILDVLGDKVIMPLGGHDATRVMESYVADTTTLESRYEILQSAWQHDIHYSNKIVKDRVMLVQLNNGQSKYYGDQAKKLAADIKYARENNLIILIFQHEPIATSNTEYARTAPISGGNDYENFYKNYIGGSKYGADEVTKNVYDLITKNADVIRGVFCGHLHNDYYLEINASYQKDGATVNTTIPQVVLNYAPASKGSIMIINVK